MKKKNYFLGGLLGFVLVIIATAITFFISLTASGALTKQIMGNARVCAIHPFAFPGMLIAIFLVFEVILFLRQAMLAKGENPTTTAEEKAKFKKIFMIAVIVCAVAIVLCAVGNITFRTELSEGSIKKITLFSQKEYRENNVAEYRLNCDENGVDFTVIMRDGSTFELFNNTKTATDAFLEKYGSIYGYAAALSEDFDSPDGDYTIKRTIIGEKYIVTDKNASDYETKWKYINMIAEGIYQ